MGYHLYTYKKYTDVRLVFAPEFDIAFLGGDPDNFEYPRYNLDVCFFRAYENEKPARIEHFLRWSKHGSREGDLVFVAGHPGRTDRLNTLASLEYLRDVELPLRLDYLKSREAFLLEYGRRSDEAFRQSKEELYTFQNSRKARVGALDGLRSQPFMMRKAETESELRAESFNRQLDIAMAVKMPGKRLPMRRKSLPGSSSRIFISRKAMHSLANCSRLLATLFDSQRKRRNQTPID